MMLLGALLWTPLCRAQDSGSLRLFDATVQTVQTQVGASAKAGGAWSTEAGKMRQELLEHGAKTGEAQVQLALEQLLAKLDVGRVELLSADEQRYWTYLSAFSGQLDGAPLRHIGAWYERHGKHWFITRVMADGPAARAGLVAGDELLQINGQPFSPVNSLQSLAPDAMAQVTYQRLPWSKPKTISVSTEFSSLQTSLLREVTHGQKILSSKQKRIAYLALPMSSNAAFRTALLQFATQAQMQSDAMVLDLRGDYGAVGLTYSEAFLSPPAGPGAQPAAQVTPYTKPLVVLIDHGTSGGRENLAWLLKHRHRAVIVGHASAGQMNPVQAAEVLPSRYLLVTPANVGGQTLAARGVNPDIVSDPPHIFTAGHDQALDVALSQAADLAP
jgi:carboxyl-terminal processing protease